MSPTDIWAILGVAPTQDGGAIRRAYARQLKINRPEDDAAGFQRLRAAYELALRLVRVAEPTVVMVPAGNAGVAIREQSEPAPPSPHPVPPVDAEIAALASALQSLQATLRGADEPDSELLTSHLQSVLESPALERLAVRHELETALAAILVTAAPRSDPLLDASIRRFGWEKQAHGLEANHMVLALLARRRDAIFFEELRFGSGDLSLAYEKLREKAPRVMRSWRAWRGWVSGPPGAPELELLTLLRDRHPNLVGRLDANEVEWWQRFGKRPPVSRLLVQIVMRGLLFAVLSGWVVGASNGHWILTVVGFAAYVAIVGMTVLVRGLLDKWSVAIRVERASVDTRVPEPRQVAWLPILLLLLLAVACLPGNPLLTGLVFFVALGCSWWALDVSDSRPMLPLFRPRWTVRALSQLNRVVVPNLVLVPWWLVIQRELALDSAQELLAGLGVMCASATGMPPLHRLWLERLQPQQRQLSMAALLLSALGVVTLLVFKGADLAWRPFLAALVVTIVGLHRVPHPIFGKGQRVTRFIAFVSCAYVLDATYVDNPTPAGGVLSRIGGVLLLCLACLNLAFAMYNEYRQRSADQQGDAR